MVYQSQLAILDVVCEPKGPDPTGEVRSGYLKCRGRAVPVILKSTKTKLGRKLIQLGSWETSVNLDYIPAHLELDNSSSTIAVLCLWICSQGENSESFWDNHFFLVLIREEGSG